MLKREALQLLEEKILSCNKCDDLANYRWEHDYRHVPGTGDSAARVMIIGEAPGENEAKQGLPFVGKAGNLLTNILKAAGWSRDEVFIANILKCRPPSNRDPEPCEALNCRKFLDMQIRIIDPEWLICFGRIASIYLLGGDPSDTIGSFRGKVHDYDGRKVICTYHPSYVLHQSDDKNKQKEAKGAIWSDLQPIIQALRSKDGGV